MPAPVLVKIAASAALASIPAPGHAPGGSAALEAPTASSRNPANALTPQTLVTALAAQNLCMVFTYDANGNRTSQTSETTAASGAKWGERSFPCFVWTPN